MNIYKPKLDNCLSANRPTAFAKYHEIFYVYNLVGRNIELKSYFGRIITIKNYVNGKELNYFNKINDLTLSKKIKAKFKPNQMVMVNMSGFNKMYVKIVFEHLIHYKNQKSKVNYSVKFPEGTNPRDSWSVIRIESILIPEEFITPIINYNDYWAKLNEPHEGN